MNEDKPCRWVPLEPKGWRCASCWLQSANLRNPPKSWTCRHDQPPPIKHQAWNLATSLAAFASDGFRLVDEDTYRARLETCDACDRRRGNRCLECGCYLAAKAKGRAFACPLDKWEA